MNGSASQPASVAQFMYYIIYKPYGVLSQFSPEGEHPGLGSLFDFPADVYPVGRLDVDSEGLLILTNDTGLNHTLLDPLHQHWRTYWIQVEGTIGSETLRQLEQGVIIRPQKKDYKTLPAKVGLLQEPISLPERNPPVRFRKSIPTSWIFLSLREGKNRQVRRMTAAVGFPTLRLVRVAIEGLELQGMLPGDVREVAQQELYALLNLKPENRHRRHGSGGNSSGSFSPSKRSTGKRSFKPGNRRS
jgi:23S rRNA pseudouridine2457 synthase